MKTDVRLTLLDRVQVASPCPARWEDMTGTDTVRRCDLCRLNVHNLSAMTRADAEAFLAPLAGGQGRVCVRYFRRADGTVLTRDCPVGVRALARRAGATARKVAAAVALVLTGGLVLGMQSRGGKEPRLARMEPFASIRAWLYPAPPAPVMGKWISGAVAQPPAKTSGGAACGAGAGAS